MLEGKCTVCGTKEYIIVAEGDNGGMFWNLGKKGKFRICDRCFEIKETGREPEEKYLTKRAATRDNTTE